MAQKKEAHEVTQLTSETLTCYIGYVRIYPHLSVTTRLHYVRDGVASVL